MLYQVKEPEIWAPMHGYEDTYNISTLGRIKRIRKARGAVVGRITEGALQCKGYKTFSIPPNTYILVHTLVAKTFLGPPPPGSQVRHLNGIRTDNRLRNLIWGTPSENQMDRVIHGTSNRGEQHPNKKLTTKEILEIRHSNNSVRTLAARYKVSKSTVKDILSRRTWAWLNDG